jgi:hypothetical protein
MLDPMLVKVAFKQILSAFLSTISMKSVNMRLSIILNPHMKFFKCFKCLRFIFQQIYPTNIGVVIIKSHDISITKGRWNMHRVT